MTTTREAPPPAGTTGRQALAAAVGAALDRSIDGCARCKMCGTQSDAVMEVLEPLLAQLDEAGPRTLERYAVDGRAAAWITAQQGAYAAQPHAVAGYEAATLIIDAVGEGLILGGPGGVTATCVGDADGEPDGWVVLVGHRQRGWWLASRMLRATADTPLTYLQVLVVAVGALNEIVADCERLGLAALFDQEVSGP